MAALVFSAVSCSAGGAGDGTGNEFLYPETAVEYEKAPAELKSLSPAAKTAAGIAGDISRADQAFSVPEGSAEAAPGMEPGIVTERKKTFSGGCTIQTASAVESSQEVSDISSRYGGRIESSSDSHITVRVPAVKFRAAFDEILSLGNVTDKYLESQDVTEFYSDLSGRLEILRQTRERLKILLDAESETAKKVSVLREIKRVDDQIENLKAQLEALEGAIAYSSITVNFIPFQTSAPRSLDAPFEWIEALDPFYVTIDEVYRRIRLELPEGFALIRDRKKHYFHAEAADGTVIRIGSIKNSPEGDSRFWQKAIAHALRMRFAKQEEGETGNVRYVLFTGKGHEGYRYLAGTFVRKKLLYVVEACFPDQSSFDRWNDSLQKALAGLEVK